MRFRGDCMDTVLRCSRRQSVGIAVGEAVAIYGSAFVQLPTVAATIAEQLKIGPCLGILIHLILSIN